MTIGNVMRKYYMSIDDVLNVRAMYGGTVTIAEVLSDIDAEIAALEQHRDKSITIKQGMMQQLLTGRVWLPKSRICTDDADDKDWESLLLVAFCLNQDLQIFIL